MNQLDLIQLWITQQMVSYRFFEASPHILSQIGNHVDELVDAYNFEVANGDHDLTIALHSVWDPCPPLLPLGVAA